VLPLESLSHRPAAFNSAVRVAKWVSVVPPLLPFFEFEECVVDFDE
jgi:hypothetical protein